MQHVRSGYLVALLIEYYKYGEAGTFLSLGWTGYVVAAAQSLET